MIQQPKKRVLFLSLAKAVIEPKSIRSLFTVPGFVAWEKGFRKDFQV